MFENKVEGRARRARGHKRYKWTGKIKHGQDTALKNIQQMLRLDNAGDPVPPEQLMLRWDNAEEPVQIMLRWDNAENPVQLMLRWDNAGYPVPPVQIMLRWDHAGDPVQQMLRWDNAGDPVPPVAFFIFSLQWLVAPALAVNTSQDDDDEFRH